MGAKPTVEPVGQESPASRELREEEDLRKKISDEEEALRKRAREYLGRTKSEMRNEFMGLLDDLTKQTKTVLPTEPTAEERKSDTDEWNARQDRFRYGDVRDMQDYLYDTLPRYAQKIRNPRTDKLMADYLRAVRWKKWEQVDKTFRQLNDMYKRADLLEGDSELESGGSAGTGAPFLPLPLANLIVLARDKRAKVRGVAQRFTSTGQTLRVPTSGTATASMVAEGSTASEGNPVLATKLFQKKKAQARFDASDELLEDSSFNLVTFFAERGGSRLGQLEDEQFCAGPSGDPNVTESLEQATITAVAETSSGELTYLDVVALFFALPEQYRTTGVYWMGNSLMMQILSQILDGNGRPIFTPGLAAPQVVTSEAPPLGAVGSIFGHPVLELPFTTATSPTSADLWVGVLNNYGILDGGGITVRASEHTRWDDDVMSWKITERIDGVVLLEDSFRNMEGIVSAG